MDANYKSERTIIYFKTCTTPSRSDFCAPSTKAKQSLFPPPFQMCHCRVVCMCTLLENCMQKRSPKMKTKHIFITLSQTILHHKKTINKYITPTNLTPLRNYWPLTPLSFFHFHITYFFPIHFVFQIQQFHVRISLTYYTVVWPSWRHSHPR